VGASNLGHIILYSILNQQEGLLCDRAYYPGVDMQVCGSGMALGWLWDGSGMALGVEWAGGVGRWGGQVGAWLAYGKSGQVREWVAGRSPSRNPPAHHPTTHHHTHTSPPPLQALLAKYGRRLFGVESRRPLDSFDVLGFSLSYELGGTNILEMLRQSGVPVTWEVRGGRLLRGRAAFALCLSLFVGGLVHGCVCRRAGLGFSLSYVPGRHQHSGDVAPVGGARHLGGGRGQAAEGLGGWWWVVWKRGILQVARFRFSFGMPWLL